MSEDRWICLFLLVPLDAATFAFAKPSVTAPQPPSFTLQIPLVALQPQAVANQPPGFV